MNNYEQKKELSNELEKLLRSYYVDLGSPEVKSELQKRIKKIQATLETSEQEINLYEDFVVKMLRVKENPELQKKIRGVDRYSNFLKLLAPWQFECAPSNSVCETCMRGPSSKRGIAKFINKDLNLVYMCNDCFSSSD